MDDPVKRTIKQLLDEGYFRIPRFQRSFSWDIGEASDFWADLNTINEESLFLGSMVIKSTNENKIFEVIDGQQRLTTLIIFLSSLRDSLKRIRNSDAERKAKQIHDLLYHVDITTDGPFPKIKLNKYDNSYFYDNIINPEEGNTDFRNIRGKSESEKLISKIYYFFFDKFQEVSLEDRYISLTNYLKLVLDKVEIIKIPVIDVGQAYIIFETLNARGVELSTADLVKNYLYSKAATFSDICLDEIEQKWDSITTYTSGVAPITSFLKHYWASKIELVRDKQLFKKIKEKLERECTTEQKLLLFTSELEYNCHIYVNLIEPRHTVINNVDIERSLDVLRTLKVTSCYPLLLRKYQSLGQNDFIRLLSNIEILSFRHNTICEKNPNELERKYSEWAINDLPITTLFIKIKEMNPNDITFKSSFIERSINNEAMNRYILRKLGKFQINADSLIEISDSNQITLEHIMPKSLTQEWKEYLIRNKPQSEILANEEYIKKINTLLNKVGNLTLLHIDDNRRLSNSLFDEKKQNCFRNSRYVPNREINEIDVWNDKSILERHSNLVELAINVWRIY